MKQKNLLIDIGNTSIKLAIYDQDQNKIEVSLKLDSQKIITKIKLEKILETKLKKLNLNLKTDFKLIVLCSVRPVWDSIFEKLADQLKIAFYQIKKNLIVDNFDLKIENPKILGSDLLVNAYGAIKKYHQANIVIVNMGTTSTITVIKNFKLEGVIIMPGLTLSLKALFSKVALLKKFNFAYSSKIYGKNTEEAINIGGVNGHLYAIQGLVSQIEKKVQNPLLIISGGDNHNFNHFLKNFISDPLLLFEGLVIILKNNKIL